MTVPATPTNTSRGIYRPRRASFQSRVRVQVKWDDCGWGQGSPKLGLLRLEAKRTPCRFLACRGTISEGRRWRGARRDGLSAAKAACGVGVAWSTVCRWTQRCEFKSRRPHKVCGPAFRRGWRKRWSVCASTFRVGQGEDRPARARTGSCSQRFHGGTGSARPDRARSRGGGPRPFAQGRAADGFEDPPLHGAQPQGGRIRQTWRSRADRHALDTALLPAAHPQSASQCDELPRPPRPTSLGTRSQGTRCLRCDDLTGRAPTSSQSRGGAAWIVVSDEPR